MHDDVCCNDIVGRGACHGGAIADAVGSNAQVTLIAILDDLASNRHIYARLAGTIEKAVTVRTFGDPIEALAWTRGIAPDLVITDYKMPILDGAQFTRRFRESPGCADVPVLVI